MRYSGKKKSMNKKLRILFKNIYIKYFNVFFNKNFY